MGHTFVVRVAVCGSNDSITNHATARTNHTLAHKAAFHQHSIGGCSFIEPSIEKLSRVDLRTSGARGFPLHWYQTLWQDGSFHSLIHLPLSPTSTHSLTHCCACLCLLG